MPDSALQLRRLLVVADSERVLHRGSVLGLLLFVCVASVGDCAVPSLRAWKWSVSSGFSKSVPGINEAIIPV